MKIIYDKEKAIKAKQQIDAETPAKNRKARIHNAILIIMLLLAAALAIYGFSRGWSYLTSVVSGDALHFLLNFAYAMSLIFVVFGVVNKYGNDCDYVMTAEERYTASIQYYLATNDKTVLNTVVTRTGEDLGFGDSYKVTLTLEDANHVVHTKELCLTFCRTELRTGIAEEIIDLDKRIVQIPYKV